MQTIIRHLKILNEAEHLINRKCADTKLVMINIFKVFRDILICSHCGKIGGIYMADKSPKKREKKKKKAEKKTIVPKSSLSSMNKTK